MQSRSVIEVDGALVREPHPDGRSRRAADGDGRHRPPTVGEHTGAVLADAGYTAAEIAELHAEESSSPPPRHERAREPPDLLGCASDSSAWAARGPMAHEIVAAGFPTTLWARRPEVLEPYTAPGPPPPALIELGRSSDLVGSAS